MRSLLLACALCSIAADQPVSRIAFGSCAGQEKPQPIWDAVLAAKPDLFIFLGDNIYADTDNVEIMRQKYGQLGAQPGFQRLRAAVPVMAVWDDHDFGSDDIGADNPIKVQSQKLFLDFFGEPADSPRRSQAGIYTARVFGPPGRRVQVILLDTRYHRTKLKKSGRSYVPDDTPGGTFLGESQWKWLDEQLRQPAELRVVGSSIQVAAEEHPFEKWSNIPAERERLFRLLKDTRAGGVVFISGDRHLGEISVIDGGVGYPLFDVTSSGLNMGVRNWRLPEVNKRRVGTMTSGDNFGFLAIDWDKPEPVVRLQVRDADGEVTVGQKVPLAVLRPADALPKATAAAPARPVGAGAVSPAEAARHVGEKLTVEFAVHGTGATRDRGRVFLNSAERRDPGNFTVVIDMKKAGEAFKKSGVDDPREHFKGKTVRVTGTVSTFNDAPQIVVEDAGQVVVVK